MAGWDKVKVLVIGDSGVGKSSLTHLICRGQPIPSPSWTIGASLDVKVHVFKDGTPQQKKYFVELWDVGGCNAHSNTRCVFYNNVNGLILVHDLTNKKSCFNLRRWLAEVLAHVNSDCGSGLSSPLSLTAASSAFSSWWGSDGFDPETFAGSSQVKKNCNDRSAIPSGSSAAVKLSRFFDKVIERRFHPSSIVTSPSTSLHSSSDRYRRSNPLHAHHRIQLGD